MTTRKINSTNYQNRAYLIGDCILSEAMADISGRWKLQVLYSLHFGDHSFSDVKKRLKGISDKMLGLRLSELQKDGCISKKVNIDDRPRYVLTKRGKSLIGLMDKLVEWQKLKE